MDLKAIMEFDHVVTVRSDGTVTDGPGGIYAPTLLDERLDDSRWTLITYGYTGQYGYRGPVMHDSEFIGGKLAADILAEPGVYVAVVAHWSPEHGDDDSTEDIVEGWAVARLGDLYTPKGSN